MNIGNDWGGDEFLPKTDGGGVSVLTDNEMAFLTPIGTCWRVFQMMTDDQREVIEYKIANWQKLRNLDLFPEPFGLPTGYIGFTAKFSDGGELVGGIDPEGRVST